MKLTIAVDSTRSSQQLSHFIYRLTAVFDTCHSQTALDLPFSYNCDGIIERPIRSASWIKNKAKGNKEKTR